MTRAGPILAGLFAGCLYALPAMGAPMIQPQEWQDYLDNFVSPEGRVIDTANGGISHSEGQGYGLLLSTLAEDRAAFERILTFTNTELRVRADGLAAWRWEPDASPHVTDANNATDGDMLIAYALILGGELWGDDELTAAGTEMVTTIGRTMLISADGLPAILPGEFGFRGDDAGAAPVLNPSYWIFEALPVFARIDPVIDWTAVSDTGIEILRRAAKTRAGIPSDWIQLVDDGIEPAPDLPPEFGYNGIRVPLYLIRAGLDASYLYPFRRQFTTRGLVKLDVVSGERIEPIAEPGYQLIVASMECVARDTPIPAELQTMSPTSYYSATLQLLLLDHLRRQWQHCLAGGPT